MFARLSCQIHLVFGTSKHACLSLSRKEFRLQVTESVRIFVLAESTRFSDLTLRNDPLKRVDMCHMSELTTVSTFRMTADEVRNDEL